MTLETDDASASTEPETEAALWAELRSTGALGAREKLFALHLPLARQIAASRFRRRSSSDIELQDLQQLACEGLLEALDRFDPSLGPPFRAFAARRITGAVLNGIAKMSELREQISFRRRLQRERLRSLAAENPDAASTGEAMQALTELAVGLAIGFMIDEAGAVSAESVGAPVAAYQSQAWREATARIMAAISHLPDREQAIVRRHYLDGLGFEQIASLMGVSKTRIAQLHKSAIARLRERLPSAQPFHLRR